jgi:hypothetical protein
MKKRRSSSIQHLLIWFTACPCCSLETIVREAAKKPLKRSHPSQRQTTFGGASRVKYTRPADTSNKQGRVVNFIIDVIAQLCTPSTKVFVMYGLIFVSAGNPLEAPGIQLALKGLVLSMFEIFGHCTTIEQ